jgi:hypothetical protein
MSSKIGVLGIFGDIYRVEANKSTLRCRGLL